MNDIEKIPLSKEMKILLLQVLKAGDINIDQANDFINFCVNNGLVDQVKIKFVNFNENEK